MSEIQLDSAAIGRRRPEAEAGEADEVSDYSEEADGFDAAGPSDDVAAPAEGDAPDGDAAAADSVQEEFIRELRMQPGDWYVVHSYAGYENRVKTNLERPTKPVTPGVLRTTAHDSSVRSIRTRM